MLEAPTGVGAVALELKCPYSPCRKARAAVPSRVAGSHEAIRTVCTLPACALTDGRSRPTSGPQSALQADSVAGSQTLDGLRLPRPTMLALLI
jgi:hypothetical protein